MDIRKADSKGRLAGFEPGEHYYVDRAGSVSVVTGVVRKYDIKQPISRQGSDYLRTFDLEASNLYADGHSEMGAFRAVLNQDGTRVSDGTGWVREWMPWPEGFDYEEFVRLANL